MVENTDAFSLKTLVYLSMADREAAAATSRAAHANVIEAQAQKTDRNNRSY
jgi:hypothetical protein